MMDKLIDNMGDMGLVDTVPLQYNTKAVNFISVTMFVNCVRQMLRVLCSSIIFSNLFWYC